MRWLILLFFPTLSIAQPHSAVEDFNLDGKQDSITWEWDCGSSSCAFFYGFFDGTSRSSAEGMMEQPFSDFIDVIGLPQNMGYDQATWERIFSTIFREDSIRQHTPSLDWYISAYLARANASNNESLQNIFRVSPRWMSSAFRDPTFTFRYIEGDSLDALRDQLWVGGDTDSDQAILVYYGQNHVGQSGIEAKVIDFQESTLLHCKHGLVWQKDGQYTWVLAHDRALFGGPSKLRWASVHDVLIFDDLVVVLILGGIVQDYHFLLVHPETGTIATIYHDGLYTSDELEYTQLNNLFQLNLSGELKTFDIPELGRQLQKLSTD